MKICLTQYLSCNDVHIHSLGLAGKQRKVRLLKMSPLKAWNGILIDVKENHALPGLHVSFADKEKIAEMNGLCTGDGLQEMLEGRDHYALDMVFSFVAIFSDKSVGFETKCDLTRTSAQ